jgi:hypothetical protein
MNLYQPNHKYTKIIVFSYKNNRCGVMVLFPVKNIQKKRSVIGREIERTLFQDIRDCGNTPEFVVQEPADLSSVPTGGIFEIEVQGKITLVKFFRFQVFRLGTEGREVEYRRVDKPDISRMIGDEKHGPPGTGQRFAGCTEKDVEVDRYTG